MHSNPANVAAPASSEHLLGAYIPEHYHYQMLLDEARMSMFQEAIQLLVPKGGRVLELGAGTGVLSSFAARQGARVFAIERQPQLAEKARSLLALNGLQEQVTVITADARDYLPDEPVDVVICEMLHSALLREHQVQVIEQFRKAYLAHFETLPAFIPTASLLGVEPVQVDFHFHGYEARLPIFEDPSNPLPRIESRGAVAPYAIIDYQGELPARINGDVTIEGTGDGAGAAQYNALRFITNNVLAIRPADHSTIAWLNQNLILPLPASTRGRKQVRFSYAPGDEIGSLVHGLSLSDA